MRGAAARAPCARALHCSCRAMRAASPARLPARPRSGAAEGAGPGASIAARPDRLRAPGAACCVASAAARALARLSPRMRRSDRARAAPRARRREQQRRERDARRALNALEEEHGGERGRRRSGRAGMIANRRAPRHPGVPTAAQQSGSRRAACQRARTDPGRTAHAYDSRWLAGACYSGGMSAACPARSCVVRAATAAPHTPRRRTRSRACGCRARRRTT